MISVVCAGNTLINLWSTFVLARPVLAWRGPITSSRFWCTLASPGAPGRHGKEGVDGSSPSEGLKHLQNGYFYCLI